MSIEQRLEDLARTTDEAIRGTPPVGPAFVRRALRHRAATAFATAACLGLFVVGGTQAARQLVQDDPTRAASDGAPAASRLEVRQTIEVGPGPQAVAAGFGGVWVALPDESGSALGEFARIDPATGKVESRTPLTVAPYDALATADAVWVTGQSGEEGLILRLHPDTGATLSTTPVEGMYPREITADGDTIWISAISPEGTEGSVLGLDATSGAIEHEIPVPASTGDLVARGDSVWVLGSAISGGDTIADAAVYEIDPAAGGIAREIGIGGTARAIELRGPDLWVSRDGTTAIRIDRASAAVHRAASVAMGFEPFAATSDGRVWFAGTSPNREGDAVAVLVPEGNGFHVRQTLDLDVDVVDAALDAATGSAWLIDSTDTLIEVHSAS